MRIIRAAILAAIVALSPAAHGLDGWGIETGHSNSTNANVSLYRVTAHWDWRNRLVDMGGWQIGGYWEANLGYWRNRGAPRDNDRIYDVGVTPVLRLQPNRPMGISPYVELGLGVHLLSHASVSSQRKFGTALQFGDHLGVGIRLGDNGHYDFGYRYQHLSNAGIRGPNQGINFHSLNLQLRFN